MPRRSPSHDPRAFRSKPLTQRRSGRGRSRHHLVERVDAQMSRPARVGYHGRWRPRDFVGKLEIEIKPKSRGPAKTAQGYTLRGSDMEWMDNGGSSSMRICFRRSKAKTALCAFINLIVAVLFGRGFLHEMLSWIPTSTLLGWLRFEEHCGLLLRRHANLSTCLVAQSSKVSGGRLVSCATASVAIAALPSRIVPKDLATAVAMWPG